MNPSGASRKTSHGSAPKGNMRHKKLSKQPSDPLSNRTRPRQVEVKDIYSSSSSRASTRTDDYAEDGANEAGVQSLRRFSQSGVTPGSEEFQSVLKDFIPKAEETPKQPKRTPQSKTKFRKISFNEFGRASRFNKRWEDMSLSPRLKRSSVDTVTTPTTCINHTYRTTDYRKFENNETLAQSRKSLPFQGVKEAWHGFECSFEASKLEKRRHVSLPAPPTAFSLDKATNSQETLVEPFRAEKTPRNKSNSNCSVRAGRKISTVVSPNLSMSEPLSEPIRPTRKSSDSSTTSKNEKDSKNIQRRESPHHCFSDVKKKQLSHTMGQDLHPNLLLGIKCKQTGSNNDGELPSLEKQLSAEDPAGEQHVAMKAHKNFKRIGKAALAARRFLKIRNEAPGSTKHAISPLAREEKEFNEIVEVMKASYQDLCLGDKQKSDLSDEL